MDGVKKALLSYFNYFKKCYLQVTVTSTGPRPVLDRTSTGQNRTSIDPRSDLDREEKATGREKVFELPRPVLDRTTTTDRRFRNRLSRLAMTSNN
uniref:Uncharacterized protein n=1 Tax=Vitis vinifera TaxID=29760 RepID=A5BT82_VITVI|nr:hypothetical protein VITISV_043836 [Vitis vinifera]